METVTPYKEIIEDGHPVIVMSGRDMANLLIMHGLNTDSRINQWLISNYPYKEGV